MKRCAACRSIQLDLCPTSLALQLPERKSEGGFGNSGDERNVVGRVDSRFENYERCRRVYYDLANAFRDIDTRSLTCSSSPASVKPSVSRITNPGTRFPLIRRRMTSYANASESS
jgi:hypothetical protein